MITDSSLLRIAGEDVNYLFERSPKLARELVLRLVDQLNAFREERRAPELGRVAAFARISDETQATVIVENVAVALQLETGASVIHVHLVVGEDAPSLADWEDVCRPLSEESDEARRPLRKVRLRVRDGDGPTEAAAPMIGHLAGRFRYVVVLLDDGVPAGVVTEYIKQADVTYVLFSQTADDLYRAHLLMRHLRDEPSTVTDVLPVVCLEYAERAHSFLELRDKLGADVHAVIHCLPRTSSRDTHSHYLESSGGRFSSHVRHLAREIGRCRVGLALSSGGAKGFAYVGIIQVLEEKGIHVDVVAGTSNGRLHWRTLVLRGDRTGHDAAGEKNDQALGAVPPD